MEEETRYRVVDGVAPDTPELEEPKSFGRAVEGVDEVNRKLDLILKALGIEEEQR